MNPRLKGRVRFCCFRIRRLDRPAARKKKQDNNRKISALFHPENIDLEKDIFA
jgi:hypothetical protein